MSRQKTFTILVLGLALAFGVAIALLAVFGEGESELALTEYFQQIDPIVSGIDDRTGAQVVDEPAQAFTIWELALSFTARDLDAIDPPREVAAVHQELVDAIRAGLRLSPGLRDASIVVSASHGIVTLRGSVACTGGRGEAESAAWAVGGVVDVDNQLLVERLLAANGHAGGRTALPSAPR